MVRRTAAALRRYLLAQVDTPAVVLLYHRVIRLPSDPQLLAVKPDNFYDHVSWLKSHYTLLNIDEFTALVGEGKKMPKRAVVLTFDDGYADNRLEALPILETLQGQALFYITTSRLDTAQELWWDELERIFLLPGTLPPILDIEIKGRQYHWPTGTKKERTSAYHLIHPLLKFLIPSERDRVIGQLLQWAGLDATGRPSHRMLTSEELIQMHRSPAAVIGAHTHRHPALSALTKEQQREEIFQSRDILKQLLGDKILHFSYPFGGKRDYNQDSVQLCKEAGFKLTGSNFYGQVHRWTDPWQVPRILVRDWPKAEFARYLSKFFIS
ncbi:MAG TPA: polysaccharide deacetylase family protein [Puia sp.]|nr:polysaccharide deacetylase family protein [Puia sp.]